MAKIIKFYDEIWIFKFKYELWEWKKNIHMSSPELNQYIMKDICYVHVFFIDRLLYTLQDYHYASKGYSH